MHCDRVAFKKEKETLLFTLYGKALDSRSPNSVLHDRWAEEATNHIDYDFTRLRVREYELVLIACRAKQFDMFTAQFIAAHPAATVLHLGCGLDSRVLRVDPPPTVKWFDVDYPDVIELRRRVLPGHTGYTMIGSPLSDLGWLEQTPVDQPAIVVAEGVMMYLAEEMVQHLINRIADYFTSGQMVFDAWNRLALRGAQRRGLKGTGVAFRWAIDDPQEITDLDPHFRIVKEFRTHELLAYDKMSWTMRTLVRVMDVFPTLRRMNRILLYHFS
jgi:O-methyltransferase involved in polyketide biosynthesis